MAAHQAWSRESYERSVTGHAWLKGNPGPMSALREVRPARHWLARLFRHKLRLCEECNLFGNLVGARPRG